MSFLAFVDLHGLVNRRRLALFIRGRGGAFDDRYRLKVNLRAYSHGHILKIESVVIFEASESVIEED